MSIEASAICFLKGSYQSVSPRTLKDGGLILNGCMGKMLKKTFEFDFSHISFSHEKDFKSGSHLKASTKLPVQRRAKPALLLSPPHHYGEFYFNLFWGKK